MKDFTQLVDLASERLGGKVLAANDEFFAPKENLLKEAPPIFVEGKYTDRGKWMDGWETRRRRTPGYDWCVVRLGLPGIVHGIIVDTRFFKGNYPEQCSLEGCALAGNPAPRQERHRLENPATRWVELLPKSALRGDSQNPFAIENPQRCTHLRLKIYPDGGVARLRVHGQVLPAPQKLVRGGGVDLAAIEMGGRVLASSDQFFSSPLHLLMPGRARNMGDGWETRRRRGPGHDWAIVQLGIPGAIRRIEVDTSHFKGNYPESCSVEATRMPNSEFGAVPRFEEIPWKEILPRARLKPDTRHLFRKEIRPEEIVSHVRFNIFPDGGVSRLRIFGVAERVEPARRLDWLNSLPAVKAVQGLLDCCGSRAWASQMAAARPFENTYQALDSADRIWAGLGRNDWLEAFRHHPPIGGRKAARKQSSRAERWSAKEQSAVQETPGEMRAVLEAANSAYLVHFGYIFIVCAAGKTTEEILRLLKERLANDPETELRVAAEEQRRITRLRLERLFES